MEPYTDFAAVYDLFMDNVPYEEWKRLILSLFEKYGAPALAHPDKHNMPRILDLGCGTGTLTCLLADAGYDMIGIDLSADMLTMAAAKKKEKEKILYLRQDMRNFVMPSPADAVVSICDSINYVLTEAEVAQTFSQVRQALKDGGTFIFDFNTVYKYENIIGDSVIAENREDASFIWENYYNPDEELNEYDVTFFIRDKENPEHFLRSQETHVQRGYRLSQMEHLLAQAGLTMAAAFDGDTLAAVTEESERIFIVAH